MHDSSPGVVVAGHICLDLVIDFGSRPFNFEQAFRPGKLLEVGPPLVTTGGCVSNTGLALARLGIPTQLIARIGDDLFGRMTRGILESFEPRPMLSLIEVSGESSSYTVVVDPPGVDRLFLHSPGVNQTFRTDDVALPLRRGTRILHFGYPPMLPETYTDGGQSLAALFRQVRASGVCVTLDMALPGPGTEAGRVDWRAWLDVVMPEVDVFLPSVDELSFMLGEAPPATGGRPHEPGTVRSLAERCVGWGAGVVVIKMGEDGLYLRSSADPNRFSLLVASSGGRVADWTDRELLAPCLEVEVIGTTGAGDATIAGFIASLMHGLGPEEALRSAVTVGAFSVEGRDPASRIPPWEAVQERIVREGG